jgi:hypothetical protein
MSLQGIPFSGSPLNAQVAPTSGHSCLMQGNSVTVDMPARSGIASLSALILPSALALRVHSHRFSEAAAIAARRTPQPTSSERPRAQKTRAGQFPLFVARVCPSRSCRISEQEGDYENR